MRLVTWNCARGAYAKKVPLLDSLAPDIAVVQECGRPKFESEQCLWFGDNPRQGLAVQAYGDYRLRALPQLEVPKYVIPVEVTGPNSFLLFAIWAKHNPGCRYIEGVVLAVQQYTDQLSQFQAVLIGDLNSNAIWDSHHPPDLNHTALVQLLDGHESRPYHIDYCFLPKSWMPRVQRVVVGSYGKWKGSSDHRPLLVELNLGGPLCKLPEYQKMDA